MTTDIFPNPGRVLYYWDNDRTATRTAYTLLAQKVGVCCPLCGVVWENVPKVSFTDSDEFKSGGYDQWPVWIRRQRQRFNWTLESFSFWAFGRWAAFPKVHDDEFSRPLLPTCDDCSLILGRSYSNHASDNGDWEHAVRLDQLSRNRAYKERRNRNIRNILRIGPDEVAA